MSEIYSEKLAVAISVSSIASPAISAAAAATAAASTAATASATATTAAVTAASSATAASAFTLRTRFVHHQRAAQKVLAVERGDGFLCLGVVTNLREAEPAGLSRKPIAQQRQRIRLHADLREQRSNLLFCSLEREIPNVKFLHGRSPGAPLQAAGHICEAEGTKDRPRWPARLNRAGRSRLKQGLQQLRGHDAATGTRSQRFPCKNARIRLLAGPAWLLIASRLVVGCAQLPSGGSACVEP
jgi:hypothetical protein